tara:strand:+ start:1534 stop:2226 length:693 start_codon:yes stop_codon:yes gene_type:complete
MTPDTMTKKHNTNTNREKGKVSLVSVDCELCCVCLMILFVLGLVISSITAFVVWIIALINGKNLIITEKCTDNQLWEWLLVFGIVIFILTGGNMKKQEGEDNYLLSCCKIFCNLTLIGSSIALCWWGNEELEKDNKCIKRNYDDSIFYKTVIVFWWFQFITLCIIISILGILIVGLVTYSVLINCKCGRTLMDNMSKKKNNNSNDDLIEDIMNETTNNTGQYSSSDLLEI